MNTLRITSVECSCKEVYGIYKVQGALQAIENEDGSFTVFTDVRFTDDSIPMGEELSYHTDSEVFLLPGDYSVEKEYLVNGSLLEYTIWPGENWNSEGEYLVYIVPSNESREMIENKPLPVMDYAERQTSNAREIRFMEPLSKGL